jgi:pimeloyl-ACP methyl ester carboxylesterase
MTALCWANWVKRYEKSGYKSIAPNWPGRDRGVDDLRRVHPDENLGKLTLSKVVEHFATIIKALERRPVAIGHSMGGLVVQLLMQMDLLAAAVAIDTAPPAGVWVASWSFLRSNWPHAVPGGPIAMSFRRFQCAFVNGLPIEEQKDTFDRYVVPESRRVPSLVPGWAVRRGSLRAGDSTGQLSSALWRQICGRQVGEHGLQA